MKIRNLFWPHKKNNYHPHVLKPLGLAIVLFFVAVQPLVYNVAAKGHFQVLGYATDISTSNLYSLTNQQRSANGVPALSYNSLLAQAAQNKAADMFAKNYWAHNSPDGLTPWYFISGAGYKYTTAGENLAKDFSTSAGVIDGWMNSPAHRANMLSSSFNDVGFAVMNGNLLGSPTTLVVAMYGAQAAAPAPPPPAPAKTTPTSTPTATTPTPANAAESQPVQEQSAPAAPTTTSSDKKAATSDLKTPTDVKGTNTSKKGPDISLPVVAKAATLQTLNWGQRATVFLLSALLLINLLKHTLVWRAQKRGYKHIWLRAHPVAQTAVLLIAIMVTVSSSYGVIV